MNDSVVVVDFETTGLSPSTGARATEVAAVRIVGDEITDNFQSLIKTGAMIPPEIVRLTGIDDSMLRNAPLAKDVMFQLLGFIGKAPLVAHNAKFDHSFFESECQWAGLQATHKFICSMKLAKRIYPRSPNFKLGTLLEYADIPCSDRLHRALADAMATAQLWLQMRRDLSSKYQLPSIDHTQLASISTTRITEVASKIDCWRRRGHE